MAPKQKSSDIFLPISFFPHFWLSFFVTSILLPDTPSLFIPRYYGIAILSSHLRSLELFFIFTFLSCCFQDWEDSPFTSDTCAWFDGLLRGVDKRTASFRVLLDEYLKFMTIRRDTPANILLQPRCVLVLFCARALKGARFQKVKSRN